MHVTSYSVMQIRSGWRSANCLKIVLRGTTKLTLGTDALVAVARNSLPAVRHQYTSGHPALQCKLSDTHHGDSGVTHPEQWLQSLGKEHQMQRQQNLCIGTF